MNNFSPRLEEHTDDQLLNNINSHNPLFAALSSDELTRRRLRDLNTTIEEANRSTSRYSDVIIVLTVTMAVIALLQLTAAIFPPPDSLLARVAIFITCIGLVLGSLWVGVKGMIKSHGKGTAEGV